MSNRAITSGEDAADPAARLNAVLSAVLLLITAHFGVLGRFALPLWTRFSRARRRLTNAFARVAAGRPATTPRSGAPARKGGAPAPYLPRRLGWLVHMAGFQAANLGSQLDALLRDPAIAASIAASPAAARTLRPLCRLLGVTPPPAPVRAALPPAEPASAEMPLAGPLQSKTTFPPAPSPAQPAAPSARSDLPGIPPSAFRPA